MTLVDTSIWIEHLSHGNPLLADHLDDQSILTLPFVIGELALGNLRDRTRILAFSSALPKTNVASDTGVLRFIDEREAQGSGIGYVDAHLLAATALTPDARLWMKDRRLREIADRIGVAVTP